MPRLKNKDETINTCYKNAAQENKVRISAISSFFIQFVLVISNQGCVTADQHFLTYDAQNNQLVRVIAGQKPVVYDLVNNTYIEDHSVAVLYPTKYVDTARHRALKFDPQQGVVAIDLTTGAFTINSTLLIRLLYPEVTRTSMTIHYP
jgi:hypothetical protein